MVIGVAQACFHHGSADLRIGLDEVFREIVIAQHRSRLTAGNGVGQYIEDVGHRRIVSVGQEAPDVANAKVHQG